MVAVCGLSFLLRCHRCHSSAALRFLLDSFLSTNSTCDGDRNMRKTRLPSRPVTSRTATVDYERGARFVFCRKTLACIGTNKRQARVLCLPTMPDRNNTNQVPRLRARDFRMILLRGPRKAAQHGILAGRFSGGVKASTICGGKEPQALMRAPCIYARCRELCLAATWRRQ